jgi:hypothetical protein
VSRRYDRRHRQPLRSVLASDAGELIEMMTKDRQIVDIARCAPIPTRDFNVRNRTPRG